MAASRQNFPVLLTQAQRKAVVLLLPNLKTRLKLEEKNQRTIQFSLDELAQVVGKAAAVIRHAQNGMLRNTLRRLIVICSEASEHFQGIGAVAASERLYQFKITLKELQPPIWRRIQVKDCTLDKLHEHIQTAMGWTNSHLHKFQISGEEYGDPDLLDDGFDDHEFEDSTTTKISDILPKTGERFRFEYEYDFGDGWEHEVLFEGCVRAEPGSRYPVCVEGARACPPEDVGGTGGYEEFLETIADPDHEEHEETLRWAGGKFDPEEFDVAAATKAMRKGLPDWRKEEWI